MSCSFNRQLRFAIALVDSHARLVSDALLEGRVDLAKHNACIYGTAQKFLESRIWYDWKCSSYKIFLEKFYSLLDSGDFKGWG